MKRNYKKNIMFNYYTLIVACTALFAYSEINAKIVDIVRQETNQHEENHLVSVKKSDKVLVKLYYECMCPYCRMFDNKQVLPALADLSDYIDLQTFPYGNAEMKTYDNGTIEVKCQHGPKECYGNQLHACVLDLVKDRNVAFKYNGCMMSTDRSGRGSDDKAADKCSEKFNVDSESIKKCAKSDKGFNLLVKYGKISEKVGYNYVPYVLINGNVFDIMNKKLKQAVCDELKSPPATCNKMLY